MDIYTLIQSMRNDGTFMRLATNPRAQFGIPARRYIGAELLPERTVTMNAYREDAVRYRTVLANNGTRYSPAQKKGSALVGSFLVELSHSDIATELTAREYDILISLLGGNQDMQAVAQVINFTDVTVNLALAERNELMRWQAIVDAQVTLEGDNGYSELVAYPNPANHRAAAGGAWSNDSYDPWADITAMSDMLEAKGQTVRRIITSRQVLSKLANNANVKGRVGLAVVSASGQIQGIAGRATRDAINNALERDGLPPIETYDLQYRTQTGTGHFLKRDVFVMGCTTGRDETIDLGDDEVLTMQDTIGYTAMGRAAGQGTPGRVIRAEAFSNKPPRLEAEGWQASLPVVLDPEAVGVITSIT